MVDATRVQIPLRRWERIKRGWNDNKSQAIESTILEPLSVTSHRLTEIILDINEFVTSMERKIEEIEDS